MNLSYVREVNQCVNFSIRLEVFSNINMKEEMGMDWLVREEMILADPLREGRTDRRFTHRWWWTSRVCRLFHF